MKIWKLVSGIISVILSLPISLQSCAVGCAYTMGEYDAGTVSGFLGFIAAALVFSSGVISIAKYRLKNGNTAILVLNIIAALSCMGGVIEFHDLAIWGFWALVCAVMAIVMKLNPQKFESETTKTIHENKSFFMTDDSMEPVLPRGSQINVLTTKTIESGQIAVINYNGQTLIRKITYNNDFANLEPINTKYQNIRVLANNIQSIEIIGVVTEAKQGVV